MLNHQRYRVIDRLEAGGMAEVFKGEATSVQGFRKLVAIKRVLPHLAQNQKFMSMFLDEARLGARLNHANIVSVLDIGAGDDTYFIVLEFIDGTNLKKLSDTLRKKNRMMGLKEAIYISIETCRGLGYAHELTDDQGEPLHIVHRDISPPNLLLSRRGEIKVADFGLAKAATQLEKTDPGVVKGKFSYLSPEAASGIEVDARADLFGLGVVLWELLAGRRLFQGNSDYQTVKLVQQAEVPDLVRLHPEVDKSFQSMLSKILAKNREDRFQSARELGDALVGYLFARQLKVTSYDIANLVKDVVVDDRKVSPSQASPIDQLIQEELLRFTSLEEHNEENRQGSKPISPHELGGLTPGSGNLEDPGSWFSHDQEVGDALSRFLVPETPQSSRASKPPVQLAASSGPPQDAGWVEGGRDEYFDFAHGANPGNLAHTLENDEEIVVGDEPVPSDPAPSALPEHVPDGDRKKLRMFIFTAVLSAVTAATVWLLRDYL